MEQETYPLALDTANDILKDWMANVHDKNKCDVCKATITGDPFTCCVAPDDTSKKEHLSHTICSGCRDNEDMPWIGEGGTCIVCYTALCENGARRSAKKMAGVALRKPVICELASNFICAYETANHRVAEATEVEDAKRRQEGTDRRIAAVEDVRRKRAEAEEAEARRKDEEKAAEEAAEAKRLALEEARLAAEAKLRDEEASRVAAEAKRVALQEAEDTARKSKQEMEEAKRQAQRVLDEAVAQRNETAITTTPTGRPKRKLDDDKRQSFKAKMAKTAQLRRDKLERYDNLLVEKNSLEFQVTEMLSFVSKFLAERFDQAILEEFNQEWEQFNEQYGAAEKEGVEFAD